ncbi:MAG: aminotransferase class I/II-fold pyridoxal phosphate-dependent enzyme [Candidatus Hodarchaeales archaeon]|jgi:aspartate/methionine/tyrosine aminotransferase
MKLNEFKLERFFAEHEFTAPYLLCASDCETYTISDILALEENSDHLFKNFRLGYSESNGAPSLRTEIASLYTNMSSDDILVFSGAEEGIFGFMNTLLEPGDEIIVQSPAYQSLYSIAEYLGCKVIKWNMEEKEKKWDLDISFLTENISSLTKCIVINFPHNPTGSLISAEKYNSILKLAEEHDVYVFSDEVYRFLEYDPKKRLPSACDIYEKGLSLGVMSKSFGLAGLRIGWISTKDRALLQQLAKFKDYTTICNSGVSEFLATIALKHSNKVIKRNLELILSHMTILDEFFSNTQVLSWVRPQAGPIAFPNIIMDITADEFCEQARLQSGVLLAPASVFDFPTNNFRIGYGRMNFPEAFSRFQNFIEDRN